MRGGSDDDEHHYGNEDKGELSNLGFSDDGQHRWQDGFGVGCAAEERGEENGNPDADHRAGGSPVGD